MTCVVYGALGDVGERDGFGVLMGLWVIFVVSGGDFGSFLVGLFVLFWC